MPIKVPNNLLNTDILEKEQIFVMQKSRANAQDIRPLKILLLNLMPNKIATEIQIIRLLSNTSLQIELELLTAKSHTSKNTPVSHLNSFYQDFSKIKHNYYDGLIVTGAPLEHLEFNQVDYWQELIKIFE